MRTLLLLALLPTIALAQATGPADEAGAAPAPSLEPPADLASPEILPDRRVTFRLWAPNAKEVSIAGDFTFEQRWSKPLTRDDRGVWTTTVGPLRPDMYSYYFNVDGTAFADPVNGFIKPGVTNTQSAFIVPGEEADFLLAGSVPHGEVRMVYFPSAVLGKVQRMHVYFPPGYGEGTTRYPAMYLLHGGGDDDAGWVTIGRAHLILDNLIAEGKATPMVVVMPSIWALDPPVPADRRDENNALFARVLVEDIIPYIETHYRVLASSDSRAFGGLSYPTVLPDTWFPHFDKFDYIGFTSNGMNAERLATYEAKYPGVLDDPENIDRVKIFIGDGVNAMTWAGSKYLAEDLERRGYDTVFLTTEGIHGWPWFRRYFAGFAEAAFQ